MPTTVTILTRFKLGLVGGLHTDSIDDLANSNNALPVIRLQETQPQAELLLNHRRLDPRTPEPQLPVQEPYSSRSAISLCTCTIEYK